MTLHLEVIPLLQSSKYFCKASPFYPAFNYDCQNQGSYKVQPESKPKE